MTQSLYRYIWKSPVGELILVATDTQLCLCDWLYRKMRTSIDRRVEDYFQLPYTEAANPIIEQTIAELQEYFDKKRTAFDVPLLLIGSEFQQRVWNALIDIPYGKTKTYSQLATDLGDIKAIRAVATANGANGISIIVPCHRVIGADGSLVGYAGGLPAKKKLLAIEARTIQSELF